MDYKKKYLKYKKKYLMAKKLYGGMKRANEEKAAENVPPRQKLKSDREAHMEPGVPNMEAAAAAAGRIRLLEGSHPGSSCRSTTAAPGVNQSRGQGRFGFHEGIPTVVFFDNLDTGFMQIRVLRQRGFWCR